MAKIVELIITRDSRGIGTEQNLSRWVYQLFSKDGALIASFDPTTKDQIVNEGKLMELYKDL